MNNTNAFSTSDDFSKARFGDERLTKRLVRLGKKITAHPNGSFPELTGTVADLEATYRFLSNLKVTPDKILVPHIQSTAQRCLEVERVVIAHDTTKLLFGGRSRRDEIGRLNQGNQGFLGHFALALSRNKEVRPLGILGMETLFRHSKPKKGLHRNGKKDSSRESLRWGRLVEKVETVLSPAVYPIHVMDREADDYELFSQLISKRHRFVIRVRQNRSFCRRLGEENKVRLMDLFEGLKPVAVRKVFLSPRHPGVFSKTKRAPKVREGRMAKLKFSATTLEVSRPKHLPKSYQESLLLNCVHVQEIAPPKNEEPVDWKLFTKEPIKTPEDILKIVDDYRARWLIEEYFKALKTGCSYEKRQLESKQTLLNALAVFAPVAWQLLLLRSLGREQPSVSAQYALSKNQLELLKAVASTKMKESPTLGEALLAVAALGGHIPNNGPPGWIVLGRGMDTLLTMEIAWTAAKQRCDQS